MVPEAAFPLAMPFSPRFTEVLLVPVTAAVSCRVFPSRTFPLGGVTDTVTAGGGGGGRTRACASSTTARKNCESSHQSEQQAPSLRPSLKPAVPLCRFRINAELQPE